MLGEGGNHETDIVSWSIDFLKEFLNAKNADNDHIEVVQ